MHKQLLLLHNAVSAYFSGNQQALEAKKKQFSINVKSPKIPTNPHGLNNNFSIERKKSLAELSCFSKSELLKNSELCIDYWIKGKHKL